MSLVFTEAAAIALQVRAMEEPNNPIYALMQYITAYHLPAKVVASSLKISPQTLYFWADPKNDVRPTIEMAPRLEWALRRLQALESEGKLILDGSIKKRASTLRTLLGKFNTVEPGPA